MQSTSLRVFEEDLGWEWIDTREGGQIEGSFAKSRSVVSRCIEESRGQRRPCELRELVSSTSRQQDAHLYDVVWMFDVLTPGHVPIPLCHSIILSLRAGSHSGSARLTTRSRTETRRTNLSLHQLPRRDG